MGAWDWNEFCGVDEFKIWSDVYKDLDPCFQMTCLRVPFLALLALVSAYYSGLWPGEIRRAKRDVNILRGRCVISLCLSALPVIQTYTEVWKFPGSLYQVEYLTVAVECFGWLVHLAYVSVLCRGGACRNLRGPVLVGMVWTGVALLSCFTLHSDYLRLGSAEPLIASNLPIIFSSVRVGLLGIYLVTLIPSEHSLQSYQLLVNVQPGSGEQSPSFGVYSRFREDLEPDYLGFPMHGWSKFSRLFFCWVNPLMEKGSVGKLQNQEELYDLPDSLSSTYLYLKLNSALTPKHILVTPSMKVSLLKALHLCFWKEFYGIGFLKLFSDISGFFGPLFLHSLVQFIESKEEPIENGCLYALGLSGVSLIGALCIPHFNFLMTIVGLKIRGALITAVYRKTLSLNSKSLSKFSTGEIVNFMSTDMDRIVNSCASFHAFWSIPFQIVVTLYLLYQQVGVSFLAGVGFSILLIPINKCIASKIGQLSTKMMNFKDQRIMLISEILRGIRAIKLYVWEEVFMKKVSKIRKAELRYLGGRKYLDALCVYFWATTPVLISILTFTTYTYLGNKLTAPVVFTTIALLNMLIAPLNAFPWVLNGLTEAWVSLKRVERLLEITDVEPEEYYDPLPNSEQDGSVIIRDGNFHWDETHFKLSNVNFSAKQGQLVVIMGPVGSGKSSLLAAILAELEKSSGSVACSHFDQGFGYVSQTPWLQRGTIRENILFGEPLDTERYRSVVEACDLMPDLNKLPRHDHTFVGEGGSTLSGGQKARICLARAVYQNNLVYLLDDILSSVDPHVANHIFTRCISGILKEKTRIVCTHQHKFAAQADIVILLQNGKIEKQGPPSEVLPDYSELIAKSEGTNLESSTDFLEPETDILEAIDNNASEEEERSVGSVEVQVYTLYFVSIGLCLMFFIFSSIVLMQVSRNLVDWWLAFWVSNEHSNGTIPTFGSEFTMISGASYYMNVYIFLGILNSVFTLLRAFLFAYGGVIGAKRIHKTLLDSVVMAKVAFFDSSPLGRILNRFSSDMYTIDDTLPFILNILLAQLFGLLGLLVMTLYGLPWLCLILVPIVPVYFWLQNHYRLTSRELKRLSSVTLSPVYNHFNETIQGLSTIRAFKSTSRFNHDNVCFLEANQKTQLSSSAASQWLGIWLQLIGVVMISGIGMLAILQHHLDIANPGLIGLAISYALSLTGSLGGVVNAFTETEREMVAVERVRQYYSDREGGPEREYFKYTMSPPFGWPSQGVVSFNNVYVKYRNHLPYALHNVTFSTRPSEKVGIVGRTGAGKSSLISAIFRLVEISEGSIVIDAVNVKLIYLHELRSRLCVIPQDPFLFEGTARANLDPHGRHQDVDLWDALRKTHLVDVISLLGGLDAVLKRDSISVGQRQLLCLARAVLHSASVICIDEATANVDVETDRLIQETVRTCFRRSTVLTIAHRVRTVLDSDRVLVMGDGQVLEFDSPSTLLNDHDSHFYKLWVENHR